MEARYLKIGLLGVLLALWGCGGGTTDHGNGGPLVVYSGRSQSLVEPLLKAFEEETGIRVQVKYGNSAQLALALQEEGTRSPADVFWSQDAGALGVLSVDGLLRPLSARVLDRVPEVFRHQDREWVATSGRARVLAYAPARVVESELPHSVFELTDPKWRGRVGWAQLNASFQSFVTAMRKSAGDDAARRWLVAMKENGTRAYAKNTAIIEAIAAGEIDLGLPNHYYLLRFKKSDPAFPVEQRFFDTGDIGNLVNVAGVGILKTSTRGDNATKFVEFLLSDYAQQYFVTEVFEYPVTNGNVDNAALVKMERLLELAPDVHLNDLRDLAGTLELLREVGLL